MRKASWKSAPVLAALVLYGLAPTSIFAATLATATYDTGSYIFMGVNYEAEATLPVATDYSMGGSTIDAHGNPAHSLFSLIDFDVTGLAVAGNKYLTLTASSIPAPSQIAVSVAQADIASEYPWPPGAPNPADAVGRLQWYQANIKGNDANVGGAPLGYAGGAPHVGIIDIPMPGSYSIDVTNEVNAWIGGAPNHGFGLWGVHVGNVALQETLEIISMEGSSTLGPRLTTVPVPEPSTVVLLLIGMAGGVYLTRIFHAFRRERP